MQLLTCDRVKFIWWKFMMYLYEISNVYASFIYIIEKADKTMSSEHQNVVAHHKNVAFPKFGEFIDKMPGRQISGYTIVYQGTNIISSPEMAQG